MLNRENRDETMMKREANPNDFLDSKDKQCFSWNKQLWVQVLNPQKCLWLWTIGYINVTWPLMEDNPPQTFQLAGGQKIVQESPSLPGNGHEKKGPEVGRDLKNSEKSFERCWMASRHIQFWSMLQSRSWMLVSLLSDAPGFCFYFRGLPWPSVRQEIKWCWCGSQLFGMVRCDKNSNMMIWLKLKPANSSVSETLPSMQDLFKGVARHLRKIWNKWNHQHLVQHVWACWYNSLQNRAHFEVFGKVAYVLVFR